MKKPHILLLLVTLWVVMGLQAPAQSLDEYTLPRKVKDAFIDSYPGATHVVWTHNNNFYQASFLHGDTKELVVISEHGNIRKIETEITKKDLPNDVVIALHKDFPEFEVCRITRILNEGVDSYDTQVEKEGEVFSLIFNNNGNLIRKIKACN